MASSGDMLVIGIVGWLRLSRIGEIWQLSCRWPVREDWKRLWKEGGEMRGAQISCCGGIIMSLARAVGQEETGTGWKEKLG